MVINKSRLYRIGKRLVKVLLFLLLLTTILLGLAWHILRSDHDYVIRKIQERAKEKWKADLQLEGYKMEWVAPFPMIQLQFRNLSIASLNQPERPVLKINHAVSDFNPWNLLTGNFHAKPLALDSVWMHLFKDSLNQGNMTFNDSKATGNSAPNLDFEEFPSVTANFLDFYHQDNYQEKWQRAQFYQLNLHPQYNDAGESILHLNSDCHFDGLVFKKRDGGYLMETDGQLNLNIAAINAGQILQLKPSFLKVDQDTFLLEGAFHRADTNRLLLDISHNKAIFNKVLPLLSARLNRKLQDIQIDQPLKAKFSLNELLVPGRKGAMELTFETDSACLNYLGVDMTSAFVKGSYSNDCDQDGIGADETSCLVFERLDGNLMGLIPTQMTGRLDNMKDPFVDADGKMQIELPQLNPLLASNEKFTLNNGRASVNFNYAGNFFDILAAPFDDQNIKIRGAAAFENLSLLMDRNDGPLPAISGQLYFDETQTILEDLSLKWQGSNIRLSGEISNFPEFLFYKNQALKTDLRLHFDHINLNQLLANEPKKHLKAAPGDFYHLEKLARKVANNINGRIQLDVDQVLYDTLFFSNLSTQFRLYSSLRAEYQDSALIRMDQLSADFMGHTPVYLDLSLSQGSVTTLLLDLKLPAAVRPVNHFLPKGYQLLNGNASLNLTAHVPLRSLLDQDRLLSDIRYQGMIHFLNMEASIPDFDWPLKKLSGSINLGSDQIICEDVSFNYEGSPFLLNGTINDFTFFKKETERKTNVDLKLRGSHLSFRDHGNKTQKTSSKNPVIGTPASPPDLFRALDPIFNIAEGKIRLHLDSLLTAKHVIQPFLLNAQLLPDHYGTDQYQVVVDSFNFGFGKENQIKGRARLFQRGRPELDAEINARMTFEQMGKLLPSEYVELRKGFFRMNLNYQSPLYDTLNAANYLLNARIKGDAELVNGTIFYNYRDFTFSNIYAHLRFDERALYIRDLDLLINGNRLFAEGQSSDFFPFFILPNRRTQINLNVTTPHFDFGGFTAPHGLGKDSLLTNTSVDTSNTGLSKTAGFIDLLLDKGSLEMNADFKKLVYHEFEANNLLGKFSLKPDTVRLKNLRMDLADGRFAINGSISNVILHEPKLEVDVQFYKNDIKEIFRQFENFGQSHLGYQNLEGRASAEIDFKADINSNYSVLPKTIHGDIQFKLSGGQLINVAALEKVSGFLFKNRRLDHILIDTVEISTHLRGTDLYMDRFYLHSSSFDFGAQGVYSLGKNNRTRLLFAVPVSNLFRRHLSQNELNSGTSKRKGMRIFIGARHKKGRMRFRLKIPIFGTKKYRLIEEDPKQAGPD